MNTSWITSQNVCNSRFLIQKNIIFPYSIKSVRVGSKNLVGVDRRPSPTLLPSPIPPLPSPCPCLPPLAPIPFHRPYFPPPRIDFSLTIKKDRSPHHITFHFSAWIISTHQIFKTVCHSLFVCSSVHLFACFGVLQPSQWPSRQHCSQVKPCHWRKGEEKGKQDKWEKKNTTSPPRSPHLLQAQQVLALL